MKEIDGYVELLDCVPVSARWWPICLCTLLKN